MEQSTRRKMTNKQQKFRLSEHAVSTLTQLAATRGLRKGALVEKLIFAASEDHEEKMKNDAIVEMSRNIKEIRDHNKLILEINEQLLLLFLSADMNTPNFDNSDVD